jgi:hypothetical protein
MTPHTQPNGRPIHPECAALDGGMCNCSARWDYWDGTAADLERRIEVRRRLELRDRTGLHSLRGRGHGPDLDDGVDGASSVTVHDDSHGFSPLDENDELEVSGFWRESENLKT